MESSAELEYTFYQQLMRKFEIQYNQFSGEPVPRYRFLRSTGVQISNRYARFNGSINNILYLIQLLLYDFLRI